MKKKMNLPTRSSRCPAFLPLVIAPLLVFTSGCSKTEKEKEPVVSVQTTPARRATISQSVFAEAVVYPLQQATVAPKITSTVKEFLVQRGSRVKKGQLLVVLENKDLAAAAESSKGDFQQADATYITTVNAGVPQQLQKAELDALAAKSAFDAAQKVYESRKELYQQGALPRRDFDSAEVALAQARSLNEQAQRLLADLHRLGKEQALKSAQGSRMSAEGKYRGAEALLSYSEIRSPITGVVTERPLFAGETVTAGAALITVMDGSALIAKAHVAQSVAQLMKAGDKASISVPGVAQPTKAEVVFISPALDAGSTTVEVWLRVGNKSGALKVGTPVKASITGQTVEKAWKIPAAAVLTAQDGSKAVMLIGPDGKAHRKAVTLGIADGEDVEVTSGLVPGDTVITVGAYGLDDGAKVKVGTGGDDDAKSENKGGEEK